MLNLAQIDPLKISSKELFILLNGLKHQTKLIQNAPEDAIDFVGTGGDGKDSVNFSTLASFIIAASGVPVIKHGSRSVSSKSGSFDCLDALKIPYFKEPEKALTQLQQFNLTFLCAPYFNPYFDEVGSLRKSLAVERKLTVFNLLGPLLNPASPQRRAIGVYSALLVHPMIETLKLMGVKKAIVFYGEGFDEFTITGKTIYAILEHNEIQYGELDPRNLGLSLATEDQLHGGDAEFNAEVIRKVLTGEQKDAITDMALLNAAAGIFVGRDNLDFASAFEIAKKTLTSGKAATLLARIRTNDRILHEITTYKHALIESLPDVPTLESNELDFLTALDNKKMNIIAEVKMRSPSMGNLATNHSPEEIAISYENAGAAAISVLTDEKYFGGSFENLKLIRTKTQLPLLCKDIIVDIKQIKLARDAGANACLLIVAALTDAALAALKAFTESYNMTPVIEVHTEEEIKRALKLGPKVLLINHRNLQDFSMDPLRTEKLLALIPEHIKVISASGINTPEDVQRLPARVNGVLIGTALMKDNNLKKFIHHD